MTRNFSTDWTVESEEMVNQQLITFLPAVKRAFALTRVSVFWGELVSLGVIFGRN